MFWPWIKKSKSLAEAEISDIGDIVWFNPGRGMDRVPFVLYSISYDARDGHQITLVNKNELDARTVWPS